MVSWLYWFGIASFGVAALLYGITTVIVLVTRPRGARAVLMTVAIATSALWAGGLMAYLLGQRAPAFALTALDAAHLLAWTACVLAWLAPKSARNVLLAAAAATGFIAVITA